MNDIEMIKTFLSKGGNPQEILMKALSNNSNPMVANLITMAKNGDKDGIENFARNLYKDKGRDFDKEFSEFMSKIR